MKTPHALCGVAGTLETESRPGCAPLFNRQAWTSETRPHPTEAGLRVRAHVRFDDDCRNGHNSFAVTGETLRPGRREGLWVIDSCGSIHEDVAAAFPELAHLIRWHLVSSDGPLHYVANTVFHASDRDCWGLRAGEVRQQRDREGRPVWRLALRWDDGTEADVRYGSIERDRTEASGDKPESAPVAVWLPATKTGEGKARNLDYARSTAVWPEATDEELTAEPEALAAKLAERLPALLAAFRADIEAAGLRWGAE